MCEKVKEENKTKKKKVKEKIIPILYKLFQKIEECRISTRCPCIESLPPPSQSIRKWLSCTLTKAQICWELTQIKWKERVENICKYPLPTLPYAVWNHHFQTASFGKMYQGDRLSQFAWDFPRWGTESPTFWETPQSQEHQNYDGHPLWPWISLLCNPKPYSKPQENFSLFKLTPTHFHQKRI